MSTELDESGKSLTQPAAKTETDSSAPFDPGIIAVPTGEYAKYLTEQAGRVADERARGRDARFRTFTTVVVAVLAFFGFKNLADIRTDLRDRLDTDMVSANAGLRSSVAEMKGGLGAIVTEEFERQRQTLVKDTVNSIQTDYDAKLAFIQLSALVNKLDEAPGISIADRDAAVSLLRRASASADLRGSKEFLATADTLIKVLFLADQEENMDICDDVVGDVITADDHAVVTMVQAYGMRCVGDAEVTDDVLRRFRKYAEVARVHGLPATAMAYQLGIAFRRADCHKETSVDNLIEDTAAMPVEKLADTLSQIGQFESFPSSGLDPDANGKIIRVGRTFRQLKETYKDEFSSMRDRVAVSAKGQADKAGQPPQQVKQQIENKPKPSEGAHSGG